MEKLTYRMRTVTYKGDTFFMLEVEPDRWLQVGQSPDEVTTETCRDFIAELQEREKSSNGKQIMQIGFATRFFEVSLRDWTETVIDEHHDRAIKSH